MSGHKPFGKELSTWQIKILECLLGHPEGLRFSEIERETESKTPKTIDNNLKVLIELELVQKIKVKREGREIGIYQINLFKPMKDLFSEDSIIALHEEYKKQVSSTLDRFEQRSSTNRNAFGMLLNGLFDLYYKRYIAILLLSINTPYDALVKYRWAHLKRILLESIENEILNTCIDHGHYSKEILKELYLSKPAPIIFQNIADCPCCGWPTLKADEEKQRCFLCDWITGGKHDYLTGEIYCGEPYSEHILSEAKCLFNTNLTMLYPSDDGYKESQEKNILISKKSIIEQYNQLKYSKDLDELFELLQSIETYKKNIIPGSKK